jgi:hypothetical protein
MMSACRLKHVEVEKKLHTVKKEKSASSWLKIHNCLRMHGQQNIKSYWLIQQKSNFSKAQRKLLEDGPDGPKHVGASIKIF